MVEILRSGDRNRVECGTCGSLLKFQAADISQRRETPKGLDEYDSFDRYTISCPECVTSIDVSSKITPAMAHRVMMLQRQRRQDDYDL